MLEIQTSLFPKSTMVYPIKMSDKGLSFSDIIKDIIDTFTVRNAVDDVGRSECEIMLWINAAIWCMFGNIDV